MGRSSRPPCSLRDAEVRLTSLWDAPSLPSVSPRAGLFLAVALALPFSLSGCGFTVAPTPALTGVKWASDTDVAWAELQRALLGQWKATTAQNKTFTVSYRLVSNGTALVETFTSVSSGKETLSVYHRDGAALMLTHYCAQGNQARLKAVEATRERVVFSFLDATNVAAEQDVMQRLSVVLRPDGFDQEAVYRSSSGAQESTTLRFFRAE
jgi:hypothetical protein